MLEFSQSRSNVSKAFDKSRKIWWYDKPDSSRACISILALNNTVWQTSACLKLCQSTPCFARSLIHKEMSFYTQSSNVIPRNSFFFPAFGNNTRCLPSFVLEQSQSRNFLAAHHCQFLETLCVIHSVISPCPSYDCVSLGLAWPWGLPYFHPFPCHIHQ
jgi:hypothetical protein